MAGTTAIKSVCRVADTHTIAGCRAAGSKKLDIRELAAVWWFVDGDNTRAEMWHHRTRAYRPGYCKQLTRQYFYVSV